MNSATDAQREYRRKRRALGLDGRGRTVSVPDPQDYSHPQSDVRTGP